MDTNRVRFTKEMDMDAGDFNLGPFLTPFGFELVDDNNDNDNDEYFDQRYKYAEKRGSTWFMAEVCVSALFGPGASPDFSVHFVFELYLKGDGEGSRPRMVFRINDVMLPVDQPRSITFDDIRKYVRSGVRWADMHYVSMLYLHDRENAQRKHKG